jgi:hypothetical protein
MLTLDSKCFVLLASTFFLFGDYENLTMSLTEDGNRIFKILAS